LYIANDENNTLIYGDFSTGALEFNTALGVGINTNASASAMLNVYDSETANNDDPAVLGQHQLNTTGWGVGVRGQGGYVGVEGWSQTAGTGTRIGVYGYASGGDYNYGIYSRAAGTTAYAGYFDGDIIVSGSVLKSSDIRLKKNIKTITNALDGLLSLSGVIYEWKSESELKSSGFNSTIKGSSQEGMYNFPDGYQLGLIAQEVEKVFPEMVNIDHNGLMSIDYTSLTPVMLEAIKEQQKMIDDKDRIILSLEERIERIETLLGVNKPR